MLWSLILTACTATGCVEQTIQWFEVNQECIEFKVLHEELPKDGSWSTIEYECKLINGAQT
ncbi:MAG TPA: hypothetical protein VMV86_06385 [Methanosarcinales archaeon]|jgi:hypothetical protein|nr:hypothetical protein [Methanosarcinales archaeon]